jgi:hypothetical protein
MWFDRDEIVRSFFSAPQWFFIWHV